MDEKDIIRQAKLETYNILIKKAVIYSTNAPVVGLHNFINAVQALLNDMDEEKALYLNEADHIKDNEYCLCNDCYFDNLIKNDNIKMAIQKRVDLLHKKHGFKSK